MNVKAYIFHEAKKGIFFSLITKPISFIKDVKTVTVSVSYTTRSEPHVSKGKEITMDIDKAKESVINLFRKGEKDMAEYKFKIIWLNEMGEEQVAYAETEEERNARIQGLADDGYSPVWREV